MPEIVNIDCGTIYSIKNRINNKIYIGQTTRKYLYRVNEHKKQSLIKKQKYYLYKSMNKHGIENFEFNIIVTGIKNLHLLNELEKHYIRIYNSNNSNYGYNVKIGGSNQIKKIVNYSLCTDLVLYKSKSKRGADTIKLKRLWGLLPPLPNKKPYYTKVLIKKKRTDKNKPIICETTGVKYSSIISASIDLQIPRTTIETNLKKINKTNKYNLQFNYL